MSNDPDGMTAEEERALEHARNHADLEVDVWEMRAMIRHHLKSISRLTKMLDHPKVVGPGRLRAEQAAKSARDHLGRIDQILYILEDLGRDSWSARTQALINDEVPF